MTTSNNTGNPILNAMLSGLTWAKAVGTSVNLTYSFATSAQDSFYQNFQITGFQPLTPTDQGAVDQALQAFASVANITFTFVPNGGDADIMFGLADLPSSIYGLTIPHGGATQLAPPGFSSIARADVYFTDADGFDPSSWLAMHELGNATGLQDFSGYPISTDVALGLPAADADFDYTIMANNFPSHGFPPQGPYTSTPALLDIEALQYLYGANESGFTAGATSTAAGLTYSFTDYNTPECVWVGDAVPGQTTFDFSACTGTALINLNAGAFSSTSLTPASFPIGADVGTLFNNISIAYGTVIKTAIAGSGETTIVGNNAGDTLIGGSGVDTFYVDGGAFTGGTGGDTTIIGRGNNATVVFHDPESDYTITSDSKGRTIVTETGGTKGDGVTTISGVATLKFGEVDVTLTPVLTAGAKTSYAAGAAPVTLDAGLTVSDAEPISLTGAKVSIGAGFLTGDTLSVSSPQAGIISDYIDTTGVLTLSGTASLVAYQTELDSVTFASLSATNPSRTVTWSVNDGLSTSIPVSSSVSVRFVPQTPPNFFNSDDKADILWRSTTGDVELWNSVSGSETFTGQDLGVVGGGWQIAGTGDFNGSGEAGILWRNASTGGVELWNANGSGGFTYDNLGSVSPSWQIAGTGDFNGTGETGILWRNTNGGTELWNPNGSGGFAYDNLGAVNTSWQVAGTGDFTGTGADGILWRNAANGDVELWNSNGSGGFTYDNSGRRELQLADRRNRRFHRNRRGQHPVAQFQWRRRALEPQRLGRLHLPKSWVRQPKLAGRRNRRLYRQRPIRDPVAQYERRDGALESQRLGRLHLRESGRRRHELVGAENLRLRRARGTATAPPPSHNMLL